MRSIICFMTAAFLAFFKVDGWWWFLIGGGACLLLELRKSPKAPPIEPSYFKEKN